MQRLKNSAVCPPDPVYFRFVHEDRHVTQDQNYNAWVENIGRHRQANNLPSIDRGIFEDQLCETLPAGWCEGVDPDRSYVDMRFNLRDVWNWGVAHVKMLLAGGFVEQSEAERRAKICAGCYMNVPPQGCTGCENVATIFANDLAGRKTESDRFLQACSVCRCFLSAKVWFPISVIESLSGEDDYQKTYPSFCWQKKGGENYHA